MVSDGDSKAFNTVQHVYDDCECIKLDCVGHVQKRMGKHLMNLKARTKGNKLADGKPIGGRGRLTEGKLKQLQRYYGLAIRQNTLTKANPSEREVDIAVYAMKKNKKNIIGHFSWSFSGWIWEKLTPVYSKRHLQHDSMPFFPLASLFTTFLHERAQKSKFSYVFRLFDFFFFFRLSFFSLSFLFAAVIELLLGLLPVKKF